MNLGGGHEVSVHPRPLEVDDGIRARPHLEVLALVETPSTANQVVRLRLLVGTDEGIAHRDLVERDGPELRLLTRRADRWPLPTRAGRSNGPAEVVLSRTGRRSLFARNSRVLHSRVSLCRGWLGTPGNQHRHETSGQQAR